MIYKVAWEHGENGQLCLREFKGFVSKGNILMGSSHIAQGDQLGAL